MGESELMLDTLTVDDALQLLGARTTPVSANTSTGSFKSAEPPTQPHDDARPSGDESRAVTEQASSDWREALRAAGASPGEATTPKIGRLEFPVSDAAAGNPTLASPLRDVPPGLAIEAAGGKMFGGAMPDLHSLDAVAASVASCTRCALYSTAVNPVPGEGNPNADLMCVGEAPGAAEDQSGRPFIGAAGQLLTKILAAIHMPRDQVYICNVLKHRPPDNRNPLPQEVTACSPYLLRQIELVRPKVIIALGTFAAQTLLNSPLSLGKLRGQIHRFYGVPLIVTYHPAALLRNPSWKRPTWEDVQLARRILDSSVSGA